MEYGRGSGSAVSKDWGREGLRGREN